MQSSNDMAMPADMFKFLRRLLIISLTCIVVTIALLTLYYRHVTIQSTVKLSQANSLAFAQAALISVRPELEDYLASETGGDTKKFAAQRLAERITEVVSELMRYNHLGPVVRVNVFDRVGVVIFSTDRDRIGRNQSTDTGFISAINGQVANNLIYRDIFNRFDRRTKDPHLDPNLVETYVPVRAGATKSVDAVFESYIDVSPLVTQNQHTAFIVLMGVGLVLLMLYGGLILVMRRTLNAIESGQGRVAKAGLDAIGAQRNGVSDRTAALELLSAKMLSGDEMEKKRIAYRLREGLARRLMTIKSRIERKLAQFPDDEADGESLASTVLLLQEAIDEAKRIASGLRPSDLDNLGLVATLAWFCRQFERMNPAIAVVEEISVRENDLPVPLKIVIYRVIEAAFASIARYESTYRIGLELNLADDAIVLSIDDISEDSRYAAIVQHDSESELQLRFAEAEERTILSGGRFALGRKQGGGITLRASWPV